jgi:hypothetical protein
MIRADTRSNIMFFSFMPHNWVSRYSPWTPKGPPNAEFGKGSWKKCIYVFSGVVEMVKNRY